MHLFFFFFCLSLFGFVFLLVWGTVIGSYRDKISSESREIFFLPTENVG